MPKVQYIFPFIVKNHVSDKVIVIGGFHNLSCAQVFCNAFLGSPNIPSNGPWRYVAPGIEDELIIEENS